MMDLPGTTADAQTTTEQLDAVETGDKIVFGDRKQGLEVTSYTIERDGDSVDARITVEGVRGGVYRLRRRDDDRISVERKATEYYTQRDEWESQGDVALDTFEVVEEGDGDERSETQLSLLDFEVGDEVEVESADGLDTSGTVDRIRRDSWSVKVWVDQGDDYEKDVAVIAERDRELTAKAIGWRPDTDVDSYEEDVELRAAGEPELATDGAGDSETSKIVTYRRRDTDQLVYDVRELLDEYDVVEVWSDNEQKLATASERVNVWEIEDGNRGAIVGGRGSGDHVRPEDVVELIAYDEGDEPEADAEPELATDGGQDVDAQGELLTSHLMSLDSVRSAGRKQGRLGATLTVEGDVDDVPSHVFRVADRFDVDVLHRRTERGGLGVETIVELVDDERREEVLDYCEQYDRDVEVLHESSSDTDPELVADGGFVTEPDGAEWCPECQRRRVSCAHTGDVDARADGGTKVSPGAETAMSYEERARELAEKTVLSEGEAEVAALKEQGEDNQAIADELGLSKSTVYTITSRIRTKLDRAQATIDEVDVGE